MSDTELGQMGSTLDPHAWIEIVHKYIRGSSIRYSVARKKAKTKAKDNIMGWIVDRAEKLMTTVTTALERR